MQNPLYRLMKREFGLGTKLWKKIKKDLTEVREAVYGEGKASSYTRILLGELYKDHVPPKWNKYKVDNINLTVWFHDFSERLEQLNEMEEKDYVNNPQEVPIWLGGLFAPGGFLASTRQYVAQQNQWALEDLTLMVDIGNDDISPSSFVFERMTIFGSWYRIIGEDENKISVLELSDKTSTPLPPSRFRWVLKQEVDAELEHNEDLSHIQLPIYLNKSFKNFVISGHVKVPKSIPVAVWDQRSVALTVWTD